MKIRGSVVSLSFFLFFYPIRRRIKIFFKKVFFGSRSPPPKKKNGQKRATYLFVVLRFQTLVCRYLGFIVCAEALLICASRLRGVEGCLTEAVGDDNDTDTRAF